MSTGIAASSFRRRALSSLAAIPLVVLPRVEPRTAPKMRGVCWEAGGRVGPEALRPLQALGADWISQTPFGWCSSLDSPRVVLATGHDVYWGESDDGLAETAREARALGIRTLLKPHLWVRRAQWVGELQMKSEADWDRWFDSYEAFILHYAALAERERMDGLAIGTELSRTTSRADRWRRIIARIRAVYHGQLTYCANWQEAERVPFWDVLDFIGIQAYYPLADSSRPSLSRIRAAWGPISERLAALSRRTARPVVFTEVGYRSIGGALEKPWSWNGDGPLDAALQRDAYEALFDALWDKSWFGGLFVWKWHPSLPPGRRADHDFTPQGKPALEVIRRFFRSGR